MKQQFEFRQYTTVVAVWGLTHVTQGDTLQPLLQQLTTRVYIHRASISSCSLDLDHWMVLPQLYQPVHDGTCTATATAAAAHWAAIVTMCPGHVQNFCSLKLHGATLKGTVVVG